MLYIVATPIGNLADFTFRAVQILKEVDLILAEDTRVSQILLAHYSIPTKVESFHQFNEKKKEERILKQLMDGQKIALLSDAGTPVICDPGSSLITQAYKHQIPVTSLPGPCALTTALSLYGSEKSFQFVGFFNEKSNEKWMDAVAYNGLTVGYETPHHLTKTLSWMTYFNDYLHIFIGRELTKFYEEIIQGSPQEMLEHFTQKKIRGEFVIIIEKVKHIETSPIEMISQLIESFKLTKKEAIVAAAKILQIKKQQLYETVCINKK